MATIKFLKFGDRVRKTITLDKNAIFIEKAGKRYNVYDATQEANVDTDIYKTMEKYGSLERMELNKKAVYADVSSIGDLRSLYEQDNKSKQVWNNLPWDIRKEFNNDRFLFAKDGAEWLKTKIAEEETKKKAMLKEMPTTEKVERESKEATNEQK